MREDHLTVCEDQPDGEPCICEKLIEQMMEESVEAQIEEEL